MRPRPDHRQQRVPGPARARGLVRACRALFFAGILVGGLARAEGDAPETLPLELETATDLGRAADEIRFGDLDGDGNDEALQWTRRHVSVSRIRGPDDALTFSSLLDESGDPTEAIIAAFVPVYGTKRHLVAVGVKRGGQSFCRVGSLAAGDRISWTELPPYDAVNWLDKGGGSIDEAALLPIALVPRGDRDLLLARVSTGYYPKPRAILAYEWPSGRLLWSHEMGPIPVRWSIGDCDGDGIPELFVGTYAPGNGRAAGTTTDSLCWVFAYRLDDEGTALWPPLCVGGLKCGAHVLLAAPGADGARPLLVAMNNSVNSALPTGTARLFRSTTGELLRTSAWSADVTGLVQDAEVDGHPDTGLRPDVPFCAGTEDGRVLLVRADLSIAASRKVSAGRCGLGGTLALDGGRRRPASRGLLIPGRPELLVLDQALRTVACARLPASEKFADTAVRRDGRRRMIACQQNDSLRFLRIRKRWVGEVLAARVRGVLRGPAVVLVPAVMTALLLVTLQLLKLRRREIVDLGELGPQTEDRRLSALLSNDSIGLALPIWEHPDGDREAMLRRACGTDARLRARVERALRSLDECAGALGAPDEREPSRPAKIGRYPIVGVLGRGGMSTVYLADDDVLKRRVAIKTLPKRPSGRMATDDFRREAEMVARVTHRNLPVVYAFESDGEVPYIVMEHISGVDLRRRLRSGRLPMEATVLVGLQIVRALEAAQAAGIVHRDLKPSNVMITPEGTVKVLDLGLAQLLGDEAGSGDGLRGAFAGTLGYMSPEQLRGEPVGPRTDMWGFGCIAFECASGVAAFPQDWGLDGTYGEPDWSALPAETPPAFRHLIRGCLSVDPRRRPATMYGIARSLETVLRSVFLILPWASVAANAPHLRRRRRGSGTAAGRTGSG